MELTSDLLINWFSFSWELCIHMPWIGCLRQCERMVWWHQSLSIRFWWIIHTLLGTIETSGRSIGSPVCRINFNHLRIQCVHLSVSWVKCAGWGDRLTHTPFSWIFIAGKSSVAAVDRRYCKPDWNRSAQWTRQHSMRKMLFADKTTILFDMLRLIVSPRSDLHVVQNCLLFISFGWFNRLSFIEVEFLKNL